MDSLYGRLLSPREATELKAIQQGRKDRKNMLTQDAKRHGAVSDSAWQQWYAHGYSSGVLS